MLNKKVKYSDVCLHRKSGDNHTAMTVSRRNARLSDVYVIIMVTLRQTVLTSYVTVLLHVQSAVLQSNINRRYLRMSH